MGKLVGAIDLGTNTALLLVAHANAAGELTVDEDHCLTPRLGSGLFARGSLEPAATERALEALTFFASRMKALGISRERTRVVATAVLRRASDARAFVELARARTGLAIEIISGEEEARLGEIAVASAGVTREAVVIDVGGGSTEVSCAALGFRRSLAIGAVLLNESAAPTGYAETVRSHARELPPGMAADREVFVLGGTGANLAALALGFERFDHLAAEGARLEAVWAAEWAGRLAEMPLATRYTLPIERERALILPAGLSILAGVLERLSAKSFRVTGKGLRFGVARELLSRE